MRTSRVVIAATSLWLASVLAHALGGGIFVQWSEVAPFAIVVVAITAAVLPKVSEGPALAAIIAVSQLAGHITLGGGGTPNGMFWHHGIVGLISYFAVTRIEKLWLVIIKMLREFISRLINQAPSVLTALPRRVGQFDLRTFATELLLQTQAGRAPPFCTE